MSAKYIDIGTGFMKRIKAYKPCYNYEEYVRRFGTELSLREIIEHKTISKRDKAWTLDRLIGEIVGRGANNFFDADGVEYVDCNGNFVSIEEVLDVIEHWFENHPDHEEIRDV